MSSYKKRFESWAIMDYNQLSWGGYHGLSLTVIDDFHSWLSWMTFMDDFHGRLSWMILYIDYWVTNYLTNWLTDIAIATEKYYLSYILENNVFQFQDLHRQFYNSDKIILWYLHKNMLHDLQISELINGQKRRPMILNKYKS